MTTRLIVGLALWREMLDIIDNYNWDAEVLVNQQWTIYFLTALLPALELGVRLHVMN